MAAAKYNFPPHKKGDTFTPIIMEYKVDGVAQSLTDVDIKIMLKRKPADVSAVATWSVDSGIQITDEAGGIFKINPGVLNITAGLYYYDLQFTLQSGEVKTFVEGTLNVTQDVTTS
jgi:hypothetical protein